MPVKKVILAGPRGFCAGVERAIRIVEDCIALFGTPVYIKHEIVHNKHVVEDLAKKGAITIESVDEAPPHSVVIFSAHGSPPEHYLIAKEKNIRLIDATCPLVTKVHLEVHRFARDGHKIIYIGHKGHVEGMGVLGELPGQISLVESVEDVKNLNIGNPEKLIFLTQTTLSIDETKAIVAELKKKYPQMRDPPKEDICYATTNRQTAIKKLAGEVDVVFVVGSKNSSNSIRLVETVHAFGKPAYLIDNVEDIMPNWYLEAGVVGISSGASAPEHVVQTIADFFVNQGAQKGEFQLMKEEVYFIDPLELRDAKEQIKPKTVQ